MDYKKIYESLISNAKERETIDGYYEIHHIIPKSVGGSNTDDNLVKLTLREHYFAHELLVKVYPESEELSCALWIMTVTTIGALEKAKDGTYDKRKNRAYHFLDEKGKNIRISSTEYEYAKMKYREARKNKKYTDESRKNVSDGTIKAMRNKDTIDKCISGSKGCRFYYNKETKEVHKWFPNDEDIDLNTYAWGRYKMSNEQKEKISQSSKLNKRYFIIPFVNSKYTMYEDYVKKVPDNWEEKWTNDSNKKMKQYITEAVRKFNIETNFEYYGTIIFQVPNKSKNFKIITPSLYVCCSNVIRKWRDEDIVGELSEAIKDNIKKIIELNNVYMKL